MNLRIKQPYCFSQLGQRENQEDNYAPKVYNEDSQFFVVCDGVGGVDHGEVASQLVSQSLELDISNIYDEKGTLSVKDIPSMVYDAYESLYSNRAVCSSMATTMTLMALTQKGVLLAHMGDSRIYQVRRGEGIIFRTKDHSLVQQLIDEGKLTEGQALNHPQRSAITKYFYVTKKDQEYFMPSITLIRDLEPGDVFMLCSDGVYSTFEEKEIEEILGSDRSLSEKQAYLAERCQNSDDNNTAFLVEIAAVDEKHPRSENRHYEDIAYTDTFFNKLMRRMKSR